MASQMQTAFQNGQAEGSQLWFRDNVMTRIVVGSKKKEYTIHAALLCSKSKYFHHAYQSDMQESQTGYFVLEEDDTDLWDVIHAWLYSARLWIEPVASPRSDAPSNDGEDATAAPDNLKLQTRSIFGNSSSGVGYTQKQLSGLIEDTATQEMRSRQLIRLWVLADMRGMSNLQNDVIDQLHADSMVFTSFPSSEIIAWAWENTLHDSQLRNYLASERAIIARDAYFLIIGHDGSRLPDGFLARILQVKARISLLQPGPQDQVNWAAIPRSKMFHIPDKPRQR